MKTFKIKEQDLAVTINFLKSAQLVGVAYKDVEVLIKRLTTSEVIEEVEKKEKPAKKIGV
jgi:hypothetical protein